VKEAQALADRAAARLRTNFPGWKVEAEGTYGSPAWELIMRADKWKPDLIAVGSHGRSAIGRFVLGSISQRVLNEAKCSVRVARGRVEEPESPVRIIVGVDGSEASAAAIKAVAARKWPPRSEARIILVNDPLSPTFLGSLIPPVAETVEDVNQAERNWAAGVLESSAKELRQAELRVSTELLEGNPKSELVRAAENWPADCIFVGSIGFSNRFERFVLGSVSATVAAHAHCSVEVVRQRQQG
jgi:nucleotide-binding universal stress UspA family protein